MSILEFSGDGGKSFSNIGLFKSLIDDQKLLPGAQPSYELCKALASAHPLGNRIVSASANLAVSKGVSFKIKGDTDNILSNRLYKIFKAMGGIEYARRLVVSTKTYGQSVLTVGAKRVIINSNGKFEVEFADPSRALTRDQILNWDLYFNIYDPLTTSGSITVNQDISSPNFLNFPNWIEIGGQTYCNRRFVGLFNTNPNYIWWSESSFGFSGLSSFAACLYQLRTILDLDISLHYVAQKESVLVYKQQQEGNAPTGFSIRGQALKANKVKAARADNVLGIGEREDISAINLTNLGSAMAEARRQAFQSLAIATGEPATILGSETFAGGWSSGAADLEMVKTYLKDLQENSLEKAVRFILDFAIQRAFSPEWLFKYNLDHNSKVTISFIEDGLEIEWPDPLSTDKDKEERERNQMAMEKEKMNGYFQIFGVLSEYIGDDALARMSLVKSLVKNINSLSFLKEKFKFDFVAAGESANFISKIGRYQKMAELKALQNDSQEGDQQGWIPQKEVLKTR